MSKVTNVHQAAISEFLNDLLLAKQSIKKVLNVAELLFPAEAYLMRLGEAVAYVQDAIILLENIQQEDDNENISNQ